MTRKTRRINVIVISLLAFSPLLAHAQSAPQGKARLAFYLVDDAANARLEKYLARRPARVPRQRADGSLALGEAVVGPDRVVMGVAATGGAGRKEKARYLVLVEGPALSGLAVAKASVGKDSIIGTPTIKMTIGDYSDAEGNIIHGADAFARITGDNIGKSLAVVFDGRVIAYARIAEGIRGGEVQITGVGDEKAAAEIVAVLNGGE